jgi:glyoxylase-like metal-dependent hydrolase (beta-lactamase superfamily II)
MEVHAILSSGVDSNIYLLLLEDYAYLIDTGTGSNEDRIVKQVTKSLGSRRVSGIILTHIHIDHSGGASGLSRRLNAPVMIHESESLPLEKGDNHAACSWLLGMNLSPVKPRGLKGGETLPGGVEVIHTPGHSAGSITLYHKDSKSLFPGDTFFLYGGVGRWDLPGGDLPLLERSLRSLRRLDFEGVYPGHGGYTFSSGKDHLEMALFSLGMEEPE